MPYYHKLGNIPHKRHMQFRKPDSSLYSKQLFSTEGFSNDYSLLYRAERGAYRQELEFKNGLQDMVCR